MTTSPLISHGFAWPKPQHLVGGPDRLPNCVPRYHNQYNKSQAPRFQFLTFAQKPILEALHYDPRNDFK